MVTQVGEYSFEHRRVLSDGPASRTHAGVAKSCATGAEIPSVLSVYRTDFDVTELSRRMTLARRADVKTPLVLSAVSKTESRLGGPALLSSEVAGKSRILIYQTTAVRLGILHAAVHSVSIDGLSKQAPASVDTRPALLHGDFHPGNVLWSDDAEPTIIDWSASSIGDPHDDVAKSLILMEIAIATSPSLRIGKRLISRALAAYLQGYSTRRVLNPKRLSDAVSAARSTAAKVATSNSFSGDAGKSFHREQRIARRLETESRCLGDLAVRTIAGGSELRRYG